MRKAVTVNRYHRRFFTIRRPSWIRCLVRLCLILRWIYLQQYLRAILHTCKPILCIGRVSTRNVPYLSSSALRAASGIRLTDNLARLGGTVKDGTACRLICDLLLTVFERGNYLKRIQVHERTGLIPKAARDTTKFHRQYWKAFQTICDKPFTILKPADQHFALKAFLWQKFSTDPSGKAMIPPAGKTAKRLSWDGFWLTESEVDLIVEAVMSAYYHKRSSSEAI